MNRHRCECSICTERGAEIESARVEIERLTAAKRRFSKEADERAEEANGLRAAASRSSAGSVDAWRDGAPSKSESGNWFIAETTYGDRVVLRGLPEEWTYDFRTADETYIMRDKIKRWMRFPDNETPAAVPTPPQALQVTDEQVEVACAAYAKATDYYIEFHRGLSSESSDRMRKGMRVALLAALAKTKQP